MGNAKVGEPTVEPSGKTLSIYLYMLMVRKPVGIREIQKKLNFSTPSLVHYHINKLIDAGLVKQVASKYVISKTVKVGILKHFIFLGSKIVPRYFFYTSFLTTMLIFQLTLFKPNQITHSYIFSTATIITAVAIMWIETLKMWKELSNLAKTTKT
ncbi:MAG: winged helix-turn-helix domain-containing protein [Candidatus Njordarchaeia archaeon]